jgi:hypothetical protein
MEREDRMRQGRTEGGGWKEGIGGWKKQVGGWDEGKRGWEEERG